MISSKVAGTAVLDPHKIEKVTQAIYSETFSRYDRDEFLRFVQPLEHRLSANEIELNAFKGKRCLDAGCGGGRASVMMARAGAAEVIAFDLSEKNLQTTESNARHFDLNNITTHHGSLLDLPFDDETFDIVWCNGVAHHTIDPDRTLREISRVLKTGGHLWLYLFGAGGVRWFLIDILRDWLADIPMQQTMLTLSLAGTPTSRIGEFIDVWHVPVQQRYIRANVEARLRELGFAAAGYVMNGMPYDGNVRLHRYNEAAWMGEGDLRFWAKKTSARAASNHSPLRDVGVADVCIYSPQVRSFKQHFDHLVAVVDSAAARWPGADQTARILCSAHLQTWILDELSKPQSFDPEALRRVIAQQIELVESAL